MGAELHPARQATELTAHRVFVTIFSDPKRAVTNLARHLEHHMQADWLRPAAPLDVAMTRIGLTIGLVWPSRSRAASLATRTKRSLHCSHNPVRTTEER